MNKKGVSIMIGYVLLVSIAIIMGGIMYTWMSGYVPTEELECPDGVSMVVTSYFYNCSNTTLNITIKNNGRFSIAGYYIKATNDSVQNLAAIDLSKWALKTQDDMYKFADAVVLGSANSNEFYPGNETENVFDISHLTGEIETIELIPVRWQRDENNKLRFLSCGDVTKYRELIDCSD